MLRMHIEIVVNERNMSESSLKRGPKRRLTDSERKRRKRKSNAKLNKNRIYIYIGTLNTSLLKLLAPHEHSADAVNLPSILSHIYQHENELKHYFIKFL